MVEIEEEQKKKLKFLVLGESGVGKTFLINKYISRNWNIENEIQIKKTYGIDINIELINNENETILIEFIELEGDFDKKEYFNIFINIYFKEKSKFHKKLPFHAIIYVFDTHSFESLENCNKWFKWLYNEIKIKIFDEKNINNKNNRIKYDDFLDTPIFFLGNKADFKKNTEMNLINSKINNIINKDKKYILSSFAFKNTNNLYYYNNMKGDEFHKILEIFIFQILNLMNNLDSFKNTNTVDKVQDYSKYSLKEFMYLKTFNYKLKKNYLSRFIKLIMSFKR